MIIKFRSRHKRITQPKRRKRKKNGKKFLLIVGILLLTISTWFGYQILKGYIIKPEAILVLGGHEEREVFAAKFAQTYPELPIWVSSGSPKNYAQKIFSKYNISHDRLILDYHAVDTVTNFTTLVEQMKANGIDNVYLITSENHINRARIIGLIVFGSQGIAIKPISVTSEGEPESLTKCLRDGIRAIIWLFTGETGAGLKS